MNINSGIYCILNLLNGKYYVGSATNLKHRKVCHFSDLKLDKHDNRHLQNSYNKYGHDAFSFEVIEYIVDVDLLISREQHWIDFLDVCNTEYGYNLQQIAGSQLGFKHSKKTRNLISRVQIGRKASAETKEKMSKAQKGHIATQATRQKISEGNKGKVRSQKTRQRITDANIRRFAGKTENHPMYGKHHTAEAKEKIRQGHLGRKQSEETKRKRSIVLTGRKHTLETKRKIGLANKNRVWSEEEIAAVTKRLIEANHNRKGQPLSEQHRQNISKGLKGNQNCLGKKHSIETKIKISRIKKEKFAAKQKEYYKDRDALQLTLFA